MSLNATKLPDVAFWSLVTGLALAVIVSACASQDNSRQSRSFAVDLNSSPHPSATTIQEPAPIFSNERSLALLRESGVLSQKPIFYAHSETFTLGAETYHLTEALVASSGLEDEASVVQVLYHAFRHESIPLEKWNVTSIAAQQGDYCSATVDLRSLYSHSVDKPRFWEALREQLGGEELEVISHDADALRKLRDASDVVVPRTEAYLRTIESDFMQDATLSDFKYYGRITDPKSHEPIEAVSFMGAYLAEHSTTGHAKAFHVCAFCLKPANTLLGYELALLDKAGTYLLRCEGNQIIAFDDYNHSEHVYDSTWFEKR